MQLYEHGPLLLFGRAHIAIIVIVSYPIPFPPPTDSPSSPHCPEHPLKVSPMAAAASMSWGIATTRLQQGSFELSSLPSLPPQQQLTCALLVPWRAYNRIVALPGGHHFSP